MPMPFESAVMTNDGAALMAKATAGECKIEFTKMAIGDGTYSEEEKSIASLQARTDLKDHKNDYKISGCSVYTEKSVKVTALISNMDPLTYEAIITEGYYINEVGLYAKEADGSEDTEILYSIAVTSGEQGDYMPPYNGYNPAEITQDFYVTVDNSANVSIDSAGAAFTVDQAEEMKEELDEKIAQINEYLEVVNSTETHNGIFRGKDLTNEYTLEELSAKVKAGDWSDLYIGDYITVSITTSLGGTEEVDLCIAAFDYFLHSCSPEVTDHHLVLVPKDEFATAAQMNDSNTTEGGYVGSAMFTGVLPVYAAALKEALDNHVLTHYRYLTNAINSTAMSAAGSNLVGTASAQAWTEVDICLMSEAMVYGGSAWSSAGRDIADACIQLPLFALHPEYRVANRGKGGSRTAYWLCGVASAAYFCNCSGDGVAAYGSASNSAGVRPYFLFS